MTGTEKNDPFFSTIVPHFTAIDKGKKGLDSGGNICYNGKIKHEKGEIPMKCPFCGDQESKVVDSRHSEDGLSIRRRRECLACQRRFTTYEIVESLPIVVVKRDGTRQAFDRDKIFNSMLRACDKRKVDSADLDRITTEIEQVIQNTLEREVTSDKIGEMVMERLRPIDEVAYIRFASVYRRFQDVNSFIHEINLLGENKE